jgi:hypothetical protein
MWHLGKKKQQPVLCPWDLGPFIFFFPMARSYLKNEPSLAVHASPVKVGEHASLLAHTAY